MDALYKTLSQADLVAVLLFFVIWVGFDFVTNATPLKRRGLSGQMAKQRRQWMQTLAERELRMVDTQIISGLQQGSAFFASSTIFAIGGCFALLGSTDIVLQIYRDLPLGHQATRGLWEIKVLGLALIFTYAFFKFGWSYRLFNYCSILIGAVPLFNDQSEGKPSAVKKAAEMNILAAKHFAAGLRGIFFALGYMGWFIGPKSLICATLFVLLVLVRRQYFSRARRIFED